MIQKNFLWVIQFQFLYVQFSLHYSKQSATVMQWKRQPAKHKHPPRPCNLCVEMFLTTTSFKNLSIHTPTQIHAWNIAKAAIIIRQSNETQYVDDIPRVQLRINSYLFGSYVC